MTSDTPRPLRPSVRSTVLAAGLVVCLLAALAVPADAQAPEAIRYTLRFPAPQTHYVEVEASVPTGGARSIDLMMPVWTPGSYLVREYSRQVEDVRATAPDGRALGVGKTAKNHWTVETGGAPRVTVAYRVYGREMTVRNNWIESRFAMLVGAATFLTLAEPGPRPSEVRDRAPGRLEDDDVGAAGGARVRRTRIGRPTSTRSWTRPSSRATRPSTSSRWRARSTTWSTRPTARCSTARGRSKDVERDRAREPPDVGPAAVRASTCS